MILSDETYQKMASEYASIPGLTEAIRNAKNAVRRPITEAQREEITELLYKVYCINREIYESLAALYPRHPTARMLLTLKERNLELISDIFKGLGEDLAVTSRTPYRPDIPWRQGQMEAYLMTESASRRYTDPLLTVLLVNESLSCALTR